ncbi:MAG: hypothetical protein FJZ87_00615 [Chloroflexi bacterium]|nr:hypothetical protein [Chloroflexota bacterium]
MLNLKVAVLQNLFVLILLWQSTSIGITSPRPGATLRGQVEIIGTVNVPEFVSAELGFGYSVNPTDTWYVIQSLTQPSEAAVLAVWDTSAVTDGDYNLRMRVLLKDGSVQVILVEGLKIRNDQPVEPTPTELTPTLAVVNSSAAPTPVPTPTRMLELATPLPDNSASLTTIEVYRTFGRGAMIALGIFLLAAWIVRMRKD